MKKTNYFLTPCLFLLLFYCFISCSDNDKSFVETKGNIVIPFCGEAKAIQLNTPNWSIVSINDADGKPMLGTIYSGYGDNLKEEHNTLLKYDATGPDKTLIMDLPYQGFTLEKAGSNTIQLSIKENFAPQPFIFSIVLKSGNETKEVKITQEGQNRYKFKSIEYFINKGDGASDSYWYDDIDERQTFTISSDIGRTINVTLYPFDYSNLSFSSAKFTSDDQGAFAWINDEDTPLEVAIPCRINNGTIEYLSKKQQYDNFEKGFLKNINGSISVAMNPGTNKYHFKYEMKKTVISYTLTMTGANTHKDRVFCGKWIMIQPTGAFEYVKDE